MAETNRTLGALLDLFVVGNITGEIGAQDGRDAIVTMLSGSFQTSVLDRDLVATPGAPTVGDRYIVNSGATGAWSGHDFEIAEFLGAAGWHFWAQTEGMMVYVVDEQAWYFHADGVGSGWLPFLAQEEVLSSVTTGNDTTASPTYVVADEMSVTKNATTQRICHITFSGSVLHSAASGTIDLAIFVGGSVVPSSVRQFVRAAATITVPFCCEAYILVDPGDVVEGKWKTSGATATMHERTLILRGAVG